MVLCETLRGVMTPHLVLFDTAQAATSLFVWPQVYLWMTMVQWRMGSGVIPLAFATISTIFVLGELGFANHCVRRRSIFEVDAGLFVRTRFSQVGGVVVKGRCSRQIACLM